MNIRLLTYSIPSSLQPKAGVCVAQRIYELERVTGLAECATVLDALQLWEKVLPHIVQAAGRLESSPDELPSVGLNEVRLHAPILYPGAVYCAGANYYNHVKEMEKVAGRPPSPTMKELGDQPWHFLKSPRVTVVGPNTKVELPHDAKEVDWEIELAVVIGKQARNVAEAEALSYVAGYTISNDLSARDVAKRLKTSPSSPFYFDWIAHKSFEGSCPMGPWIIPASEIKNPMKLAMKLWVGDELMQDSSTSEMIFNVAEQIAALSSRLTLYPGDVILTGTPAGVGSARKRFLQPGETVRLWIESIGEFSHSVI